LHDKFLYLLIRPRDLVGASEAVRARADENCETDFVLESDTAKKATWRGSCEIF